MKKTIWIVLLILIASMFLGANEVRGAPAHIEKGNILDGYAKVPKSTDVASSKYAVIAKFKKGATEAIYSGPKRKKNVEGDLLVLEPESKDKGNISMLYTKVATYKGRDLDLKITVTDWEKAGFPGGEYFRIHDKYIGFTQGGYDYVSLKFTYMYNDTKKVAKDLTGSYLTINDLDMHQYMRFSPSMMEKIDEMYAYEDTLVSVWKEGNKTNIGANFYENLDTNDKKGFVTFLFDGHELEFDWAKDWSEPAANGVDYNFNVPVDWYKYKRKQYFGYKAEKPIRTEILDSSKKINGKFDENDVTSSDKFSYDIYHVVPSEYEEFYYKSYEMKDKIDKALEIRDVKVYDNSNEDVSSYFNIEITDNEVVATAKKKSLTNENFYGQDYRFSITVQVKDTENLFWITKGKPKYEFNNEAVVSIGREIKKTNVVKTTIKYHPNKLYTERCHADKNSPIIKKVLGLTGSKVNVTKGFLPTGSSDFDNMYSNYTNESHDILSDSSKLPKKGWSELELNDWIENFKNGSKDTPTVDVSKATEVIQESGGVLNVTTTHNYSEIEIELCQNQRNKPNFETEKWEYEDIIGEREVYKIGEIDYDLKDKREQYSYQILGVNCNADGVAKIKEDFKDNFDIKDYSYDKDTGASRLIVVKPKEPKVLLPLGDKTHYTGKDSFYQPDGKDDGFGNRWENSCERDFKEACKSDVLSGIEVKNDSNNNLREKGTFSQVELHGNDKIENNFPNEDGQLMFFRDNKDRQVRADVWYLDMDNETYYSDKNSDAEKTDLRVLRGTPEIGISSIGPWGDNNSIVEQVNEDFTMGGHVNKFNIKSKWASNLGEPYEIKLTWTYKAEAKNIGVTHVDGDDINAVVEETKEFDAGCSFRNNPDPHQAVIPKNIFKESEIADGDKWKHSEAMKILFTRSVSDKASKKVNNEKD